MNANPDARCQCGHPAEAHEHYRRGSDCAVCGPADCNRFRASAPAASVTVSAPEKDTLDAAR